MARHYSPKSFLRQAPSELLRDYLTRKHVASRVQWRYLGEREKKVDVLMQAIGAAPEKARQEIDTDFRRIYRMADEGGTQTLLDEGRDVHHGVDFGADFDRMGGHLEKAFWTFLHHPDVFRVAQRFHYADQLSSWEILAGIPECDPHTTKETAKRLEDDLAEYYWRAQARGHNCKVDHYRRESKLYWFAYPEDYAESRMVWNEKHELTSVTQRPAFEVIFVYHERDRWLDMHAKGASDTRRELQLIFGRAILGVDLSAVDAEGVAYDLNRFLDPGFQFTLQPEDGVESALLRSLRIRVMGNTGRRITLEATPSKDPEGVRKMLQVVLKAKGFSSDLAYADRASLQLRFRSGAAAEKRLPIRLSHPKFCSLKHDEEDDKARELLRRWGIDVSVRDEDGSSKRRRNAQYVLRP